MRDNLWNPYDSLSDEAEFLGVKNVDFESKSTQDRYTFSVMFILDQKVLKMGRTRYNFW